MTLLRALKVNATIASASYLLTLVLSSGLAGLPELLLLAKLNVFALPLALGTSLFDYPTWVWYVVVLLWALQALYYAGVSLRDAIGWLLGGCPVSDEWTGWKS